MDREQTILTLVQPSARRREWQLRQGDQVHAQLRIPSVRSGARAEAMGQPLLIEPRGRLSADYVVRDETTGKDVARLYREKRRRLLELGGKQVAEWKRLGRKQGYGFVGRDGEPLLRAKLRNGLARTSGEVQIDADMTERDALTAALLASYMLIRRNDQQAASVAATVTVVAS